MTPSGLLVVDKPGGMTSHDVVARVRRALGTRKVGHAGTLDPMATGVLVIGVERATRLLGHLALADKEYSACVRLGAATTTDDADGEVRTVAAAEAVQALDEVDVHEAFARLVGTIQQRPSAVSAIKVDGRRAYDRVRAGEDVELQPRTVVITSIAVHGIRWAPGHLDVDIDVTCSTGTYIRAIARDVGEALGVGGHLTALRRTRVGPFTVEGAVALADVEGEGAGAMRSLDDVAEDCFPVWRLASESEADWVRNGRRLPWGGPSGTADPVAVVGPDGAFLALATDDHGQARYLAVLAPGGRS